MTKDVILSIKGLQFDIDPDAPVEVIAPAEYYFKNDKHYIIYQEVDEDGVDIGKGILKLSEDKLQVIKHGVEATNMSFEPMRKTLNRYETPFGPIDIGIQTVSIDLNVQEQGVKAKVNYALEINEAHVSDCQIEIEVVEKGNLDFKISL